MSPHRRLTCCTACGVGSKGTFCTAVEASAIAATLRRHGNMPQPQNDARIPSQMVTVTRRLCMRIENGEEEKTSLKPKYNCFYELLYTE
jgi:hypothetical protein